MKTILLALLLSTSVQAFAFGIKCIDKTRTTYTIGFNDGTFSATIQHPWQSEPIRFSGRYSGGKNATTPILFEKEGDGVRRDFKLYYHQPGSRYPSMVDYNGYDEVICQ